MTRFERWTVWTTSVLTAVTGVVYLWMKYLLVNNDPFAVVNHPLQPLVLKLHIIVAPLLTFAIGLVAVRHVWRHIRTGVRQGRRSGLAAALMVAPMILTGYFIQAVTGERLLRAMALSHIAFGAAYALGLLAHQAATHRMARRRSASIGIHARDRGRFSSPPPPSRRRPTSGRGRRGRSSGR